MHVYSSWNFLWTTLPGKALAQRTTDTSCLSPSSLRLVSSNVGLSGWLWSCPALTTVGSMVCKTLSREWKEDRAGGMATTKARVAAGDAEYNIIHLLGGKGGGVINRSSLSWCDMNSYNDSRRPHFQAPRRRLCFQPSLLTPRTSTQATDVPPLRSSNVQLPSACDLERSTDGRRYQIRSLHTGGVLTDRWTKDLQKKPHLKMRIAEGETVHEGLSCSVTVRYEVYL